MKNQIKNFLTKQNGDLIASRITKNWLKNNLTNLWFTLIEFNKNLKIEKTSQLIFNFYYDIYEIPKCKHCKIKSAVFHTFKNGYGDFCSLKCSRNNEETKRKLKETNLKKYGSEYVINSKEIKQKIKKTFIEKYGIDNPAKNEKIKQKIKKTCLKVLPSIQEKIKETNLKKYGFLSYTQTQEFKEKRKISCETKYGIQFPLKLEEFKKKSLKTIRQKNYKIFLNYLENKQFILLDTFENFISNKNFDVKCLQCRENIKIFPYAIYYMWM